MSTFESWIEPVSLNLQSLDIRCHKLEEIKKTFQHLGVIIN